MIFLIEYDRAEGRIVRLTEFQSDKRTEAEDTKLTLELDLDRRGVDHEVVLLEAESQNALRLTHRRYFEDLGQIARSNPAGGA